MSLRERGYLAEAARKFWWVADDKEVVLFTGPKAKCEKYYKRGGGSKAGLHLYSSSDDMVSDNKFRGQRPVVGKVF